MSWFKNPWESANPWAEGKPEFKKAIGTVVDTDEQIATAVAVGAIKYSADFDGVMGVEMRKIIAGTSLYNKYLKALNDTSDFDTYVFAWTNLQTNSDRTVSSVVNFGKDGFTAPNGETIGQTVLIENAVQFKLLTGPISDIDIIFKLQSVKLADLKPSFDSNKKVIIILIAKQFLNPSDYVLDKEYFNTMKAAKSPNDILKYRKWWDNVKLELAQVLTHELIAHAILLIKNDKKDIKTQHQNYHGVYSTTSPDVRDVLDKVGDYKGTIMLQAIREIQLSIQKLYYGKK